MFWVITAKAFTEYKLWLVNSYVGQTALSFAHQRPIKTMGRKAVPTLHKMYNYKP